MRKLLNYQEELNLDLLNYIVEVETILNSLQKLKNKEINILNININETILDDVKKGVLIFNNKKSDVSEEKLNMIWATAKAHSNEKEVSTLHALNIIKSNIENVDENKVSMFKFLETAHLMSLLDELSFALCGMVDFGIPLFAIACMVNRDKVQKVFETNDPYSLMEEMTKDFYNTFVKEKEGKKIYERLNDIINKFEIKELKAIA